MPLRPDSRGSILRKGGEYNGISFLQWNEGSMGFRGLDLAEGQPWKKG